ncbi:embigin isoform X2 [Hyaena hyaena]|uniref:embigin isoform X2 n=1 Tax=Hyaena hyaena TaxID=95912 RepID=UPI001923C3F2|nr:embigin isoform X2 [Hyaena hyaena]
MRAPPGLLGPRGPLPLALLCLLAAARGSLADGQPSASPFTSLPTQEEMTTKNSNLSLTTKYSNLSLESPNISLTASSFTSLPIREKMTTKYSNLSLESPNIPLTASPFTSLPIREEMTTKYSNLSLESHNISVTVPKIHGKNKPLVTYVRDTTVLICKCQHCSPLNWTWYSSNGSVQVPIDVQMTDKYVINGTNANETRLKIMQLTEDNQGSYWCHAVFQLGESEERVELVVLSYLVPLKPFLGIVVEVVILVAIILLYETYTQKKKKHIDDGKEFEQVEQLKSDDSNGVENNAPRHRKNESVSQ